ncbi:MAG: helix-turn-helix domain-containing protein [Adlercreutzia sp.]|nr:helix-turn-helix domain-containing protein [Adlercreutzia sp.]
MITVDDILALPAFETVKAVAPCDGAGEREVRNVGILDCPPDYNEYSNYGPFELIVTNLGFAYSDPSLAERSLLAMIKRNVAAIAVKTVYKAPVSDAVRAASSAAGVPVFLYEGAFHERVAYESLDLIQRDLAAADKSKAIDELLTLRGGGAVRAALHELAGATGATILCIASRPLSRDASSFYALMNVVRSTLSVIREDRSMVETLEVCRYGDLILTFVSCVSSHEDKRQALGQRCDELLSTISSLYSGMSDLVWIDNGDIAVRQALAAVDTAYQGGRSLVRWSDMRFSAFAQAVRMDRLYQSIVEDCLGKLATYDEERGTSLVETAKELVLAQGNIRLVAEKLFQHPNTIRYRLRKAKALLEMEEASDHAFVSYLGLVFLSEMTDFDYVLEAPTR